MNKQEKLEKLDRRIVEVIHGLPYDKAIYKELENGVGKYFKGYEYNFSTLELSVTSFFGRTIKYKKNKFKSFTPNTIGRVMQALMAWRSNCPFRKASFEEIIYAYDRKNGNFYISWKLTKENWEECTTADQSEETIDKLLELFE